MPEILRGWKQVFNTSVTLPIFQSGILTLVLADGSLSSAFSSLVGLKQLKTISANLLHILLGAIALRS
jgi:hypothetical protein